MDEKNKKRYRNIIINPCLNGWVCSIGCQTAVFTDFRALVSALEDYLHMPEETEKAWLAESLVFGSGELLERTVPELDTVASTLNRRQR